MTDEVHPAQDQLEIQLLEEGYRCSDRVTRQLPNKVETS